MNYIKAEGTPDPELFWLKYDAPVQQSNTVAVINDGTELRINSIRLETNHNYIKKNEYTKID